ncbi:RNA polymerase sigma-70 factor [Carboxylicivirga mesophila]|uniref:RNA polymerase sigma-70 factor n=1 Tax=Carboxylicivirga mesophila TaxID=1166478 RepID=A0ABS5KD00_9BACT|nr:RNA polymerase sigma-70 factor [Carboxylicivirga mesophila]MBS2212702.1 RNA polymerase sigma-70 factor [Carboxylicivirga mesophila]
MSTDNLLFELIKKGDEDAFEYFFRNSYMRLFNYTSLFVNEEEEVKDIVQEAFISVWNMKQELKTDMSIESFVFKLVRNRCINYLRDKAIHSRHLKLYSQEIQDLQFLSEIDFIGHEEEPLEELLHKELKEACKQLSPKCRRIFELCKFEGKRQKDVAMELNLSVKAVEKHISNAKRQIRIHIENKYPELTIVAIIVINHLNRPLL